MTRIFQEIMMKVLLWLSLIVSIVFPVASFLSTVFGLGGCVIPIVSPIIATVSFIVSIPVILSYPVLLLVTLIAVFALWKRYKIRSLLPIAMLICGILIFFILRSLSENMHISRFERHFSSYEKAVSAIENKATADVNQFTPEEWRHLSLNPPIAYKEKDGSVTIEFVVGIEWPLGPKFSYVYRSNGILVKDPQTWKWCWTKKVNEHWFYCEEYHSLP